MNDKNETRRAVAEIRWETDAGAVVWVGSRTLHQYWPVLSSYFREALLPPQRRAEEDVVTWTWREPANSAAVSASEFTALRKRLAAEQQWFAENLARGLARADDAGGLRSQANLEQLGAAMAAVVAELTARDDGALAAYVCRTEAGLRLHSWGARTPARVKYPDTRPREVSGRVIVDGRPAARHDVFLAADSGESVARMRTDADGAFAFPEVAPGRYRLQAQGGRAKFPPNGLEVLVESESLTELVLRFPEEGAAARDEQNLRPRAKGRRRAFVLGLAAVAALVSLWRWPRDPANVPSVALRENGRPAPGRAATGGLARAAEFRSSQDNRSPVGHSADPSAVAGGASLPRPQRSPTQPRAVASETLAQGPAIGISSSLVERPLLAADSRGAPTAVAAAPSGASAISTSSGGGAQPLPGKRGAAAGAVANAAPASYSPNENATPAPAPASKHAAPALIKSRELPRQSARGAPPGISNIASPRAKSPGTEPPSEPDETAAIASEPSPPKPKAAAERVASSEAALPREALHDPLAADPGPGLRSEGLSETAAAPADETNVGTTSATKAASDSLWSTDNSLASPSPAGPLEAPSHPGTKAGASSLTRVTRFQLSPWRVRRVADTIVPTEPVLAGKTPALGSLGELQRGAPKSDLPAAFREPQIRMGVVLEVPFGSGVLRWENRRGESPAGASIRGGQAEWAWDASRLAPDEVCSLRREDGAVLATVRAAANPEVWVLHTEEAVQVSPWMEFRCAPRAEAGQACFSWRTGSGAPLGPMWVETRSADGTEHRIVGAAQNGLSGSSAHSLALLDEHTGWALVGAIEQVTTTREDGAR